MQTTGTFPELNAGMKKPKRAHTKQHFEGFGGFSTKRAPRQNNAPRTLAGRRAASRSKAYGD
jgi:hypothetical protein